MEATKSAEIVKYPRPERPGAKATAVQTSVFTKLRRRMEVNRKTLGPRACGEGEPCCNRYVVIVREDRKSVV